MKSLKNHFKENLLEIFLIFFSLIFSSWLMFSTFSYQNGSMQIATKAWSDFASTIPLIRSFSLGVNFPPQYPLFPGGPIHYHFLFYLLVGLLEKSGLRIDFALNILSVLGFTGLLLIIYYFAKSIFSSKSVGILSIILFLFNGSLSFLYFIKDHYLSKNIIYEIISNQRFPSFGPYDNGVVSAFWNLNIYTNQRHLAPAFAISLLIIFLFINPILKKQNPNLRLSILLGLVLGLSFFFHLAVFLMTVVVLIMLGMLLFPKLIKSLLLTLALATIIALPQYLYLQSGGSTFKPFFSPGYLASYNLTVISFINYWVANFGLHAVLIPLGFIFAPKNAKKILIAFLSLFIIGNIIQFSPEIAANHKFFNYFMIIGVMFSSFFLVKLWNQKHLLKPFVIILFFFLILSGIIDFFPIYIDSKIALADYPINPDVRWIKDNTPKNSIFLNSQYIYDPASIAGRKIFMGWPYFPWSAGYDTNTRGDKLKQILSSADKKIVCALLNENKIDYIEMNENLNDPNFPTISDIFEEKFNPIYENRDEKYFIYKTKNNCLNL